MLVFFAMVDGIRSLGSVVFDSQYLKSIVFKGAPPDGWRRVVNSGGDDDYASPTVIGTFEHHVDAWSKELALACLYSYSHP